MKTNSQFKPVILSALFLSLSFSYSVNANLPAESKVLQQVSQTMDQLKFKRIEKELQEAISNLPSKSAYIALASLYMSENKNKEAIANYQEATLLDPTDPKLFASMSIAYLHLSSYEMSKAMAEQALSLDPALTHAGKIIKYIDKKQEVIEKATAAGNMTKPAE
ncbi:hypothetical protein CRYPA_44 [uncultured Candidatus Thioglobus sp.]|nr:hypothetical protein CRYPA_44 [uncultured Candidatus Thioglobus sp.]